ncbi:MAG TPA: hypothetical protein VFF52_16555 [Isosphaeraceae bacterium]|nr:hypothetical protein [Isosphaeraceae bacterium]
MRLTHRRRPHSRGLTVVVVLVCLIIITIMAGAVLKAGLTQREQVKAQEHRLQAEWLAESGLQRALARLTADPGYKGETWEVPARDLDSADDALVAITVEPARGGAHGRTVRVQADYPRDPTRRARHSRVIDIEPGSLQ